MPLSDRQSAMEDFFEAIENPEKEPTIEHRFKQKEGGTVILETRGENMFDDALIDGFVVNARDISALKQREQNLKQQNEQLRDMRKVVSHDLRNPLSVASGSLELYRDTDDRSYLEKIENSLTGCKPSYST
ncbi:MAG: histidine kinase dimerization/phospho-acceptor domain-containing protein [Halobacteriales archaeon]|nr:histidine kinase dimerization/phospho-acceptor domain-containing protein [Halobacteriales archaeon]